MKLHNTLGRVDTELKPLGDSVKIYSCGLTVYSQPHIGNWVGYIYWDVLVRTLRANGYKVEHVQNITDVGHLVSDDDDGEDKMEKGAKEEGLTAWGVADKYIAIADTEAFEQLRLQKPKLIRATNEIDNQIALISKLEKKGYTYTIENEGVYFDTSKTDSYGELAKLDIVGLEEGKRVQTDGKRNRTDFALWKFSPKDKKRDMEWDSPWGKGFPGWHIECSAIARSQLGDQIDVHTGGIDHIPIHHTNEIAQTESVTEKQFVQIWLHNNHLKVDGKKMSKSLGNIHTLSDITKRGYDLTAFKVLILGKHYSTEGNFTWKILDAAQNRLRNWQAAADLRWQLSEIFENDLKSLLLEKLNDNLNTPEALAVIDAYCNECINANTGPSDDALNAISDLLGIELRKPDISDDVKQLLNDRQTARAEKNWQQSDQLRNELKAKGIHVRDASKGQIWNRI